VGFAHTFRPLSVEEMQFVLAHHWAALGLTLDGTDFADSEAIAAIVRITGATSAYCTTSLPRSGVS
jgi:hypothetical protein